MIDNNEFDIDKVIKYDYKKDIRMIKVTLVVLN